MYNGHVFKGMGDVGPHLSLEALGTLRDILGYIARRTYSRYLPGRVGQSQMRLCSDRARTNDLQCVVLLLNLATSSLLRMIGIGFRVIQALYETVASGLSIEVVVTHAIVKSDSLYFFFLFRQVVLRVRLQSQRDSQPFRLSL